MKPPVRDRLDDAVVAEHDQGAGAAAQDPLEAVAQGGAGGDRRQGRAQAQRLVRAVAAGHGLPFARSRGPQAARRQSRGAARRRSRRAARRSASPSERAAARGRGRAPRARVMPSTVRRLARRGAGVAATRPARPRPGSRAGRPRRAAAAGRGPGAARRPGRSRRSPPRRAAAAAPRAGRGERDATARSVAGSVSRAPPTVEAKTSWACSADAGSAAGARPAPSRPASESSPDVVRRGRSSGAAGDQRLHLGEHRAAALHRHRDAGAGHLARGGARRTGRSGR